MCLVVLFLFFYIFWVQFSGDLFDKENKKTEKEDNDGDDDDTLYIVFYSPEFLLEGVPFTFPSCVQRDCPVDVIYFDGSIIFQGSGSSGFLNEVAFSCRFRLPSVIFLGKRLVYTSTHELTICAGFRRYRRCCRFLLLLNRAWKERKRIQFVNWLDSRPWSWGSGCNKIWAIGEQSFYISMLSSWMTSVDLTGCLLTHHFVTSVPISLLRHLRWLIEKKKTDKLLEMKILTIWILNILAEVSGQPQ